MAPAPCPSRLLSAVLNDVTALLERIKLLQEEVASQVNEQNSRSLFLLTVFTVLALPINIIAGLFGMNVGGIPLAQNEGGFWVIVGVVAAFTLAALWIVYRRRRD
jgi:zinc transporter